MLTVRHLSSVCLSCRLKILAAQARPPRNGLARSFSQPRPRQPLLAARIPHRPFTSTVGRRDESSTAAPKATEQAEEPPLASEPSLTIDESVRRARQLFGDALPRRHLSEEEYLVYERLYGEPVFVENAEDLQEVDVATEEVFESELSDGTPVLLRKGADGELEEVEVFDDAEEGLEEDKEGEEVEESSMTDEQWQKLQDEEAENYHQEVYESSMAVEAEEAEDDIEDDDFMRAHPLTVAGRFATSPSTIFLPKETLVDPTAVILTRANHKHLAESANRIFGGRGLPHSATTPPARLGREQKPIPLDPSQADMGNIESDAYMAAVQPGAYATSMSTLVEVRRRLGKSWLEHLFQKKGGPQILDAGSGGVAITAWHEVLKAEWLRMHEDSGEVSHGPAPLGKATVLAGSDTLRHRASKLLENTTFIPRLPDLVSAEDAANDQQPRKLYDVIIAPHTLWPLKQEFMRKEQVEKYWSLLNPKGGVLIVFEKGLPRGFEVVAAARQYLLDKHIASADSTDVEVPVEQQVSKPDEETRFIGKETGMIIAPCTNHAPCPMYATPGISAGRKDFCFFNQRYVRPPYLQRILNAKDRNHEDVQFSYVAVQRGRDQRLPLYDILGKGVIQDEGSSTQAFEGHEWNTETEPRTPDDVNPLSLPRMVLPALKRRGHIILDVCTPAGKLERWTVPRSFSKQAYRDARKARWGDLWALGAKTRILKNVRLGRPRDLLDRKGRKVKVAKKRVIEVQVGDGGYAGVVERKGGRYQQDRKIRGSGGRKGRKKSPSSVMDDE